ncbi:MAG: 50S ribosomal protein L17 [Deltaproteobacteria bacterium]|jgi:large subunit ribosomal protein L17
MRHKKAGRRLGRTTSHRVAMIRNMVTSLLEHERIVTTTPKAKEVRRVADRMITLAKRGDLHARRQALAVIRDKDVVARLFGELKNDYMDRNGGYTRIIRTGQRQGDAAPMAILELVNYQEGEGDGKDTH